MRFCFEHHVALPIEVVFGFFQNPERLELLYAGRPRVRLLHHETQVRVGAETWVEVNVVGCVPIVLGFRHTRFEPPGRFGEESVHGPFSKFIHEHQFEARSGGTWMRDRLEICLPWHYGGEWVIQRLVAPMINRMFRRRAETLSRLVQEGVVSAGVAQSGLFKGSS